MASHQGDGSDPWKIVGLVVIVQQGRYYQGLVQPVLCGEPNAVILINNYFVQTG